MAVNVARLKEYKDKLILFPRRVGTTKKGDASKEEVSTAQSTMGAVITKVFPIIHVDKSIKERAITDEEKGGEGAFRKLRLARSEARYQGARNKRAQLKAEAEKDSKK